MACVCKICGQVKHGDPESGNWTNWNCSQCFTEEVTGTDGTASPEERRGIRKKTIHETGEAIMAGKARMLITMLFLMLCLFCFADDRMSAYYTSGEAGTAVTVSTAIANKSNCKIIYNGDNLEDAYQWLASSDRDAQMGALSNTNRRVLILYPGVYDDVFDLIQYVDIAGVARDACIIKNLQTIQSAPNIALDVLASNETGITNTLSNLTIIGGTCIGATNSTGKRIVHVSNCRLEALLDCYYNIHFVGDYEAEVHFFGCYLFSSYDVITVYETNSVVYLYGCYVYANATGVLPKNNDNIARCLWAAQGGKIEAYGCRLYAYADSSAVTNGDATASAIYAINSATINAYGCTIETYGVTDGGSGTLIADGVYTENTASVNLVGCQFYSTTEKDINNTSGTITVTGSNLDASDLSGTITYGNGVGGTIPTSDQSDSVTIWSDGGVLKVSSAP